MINISQCYCVLISHVVKVVITVIRVHFNFILCQFEYLWSPEWRLNLGFGTLKRSAFPVKRGVP